MKDLESITQEYHFYILLTILEYQFTYQFLSLNRYFQWERFHQGQKAELWRGLELAAWWSPAHSHCLVYRILDKISLVSNITCYRSKLRFLFYTIMFLCFYSIKEIFVKWCNVHFAFISVFNFIWSPPIST